MFFFVGAIRIHQKVAVTKKNGVEPPRKNDRFFRVEMEFSVSSPVVKISGEQPESPSLQRDRHRRRFGKPRHWP